MFPLWDVAIAPVLRAAGARRVVEIGALRGETTVRMLESLGPEAELHVVDPVPDFDPTEHERQFEGRYFFHRALSLDVLPTLAPMDAALIDGDHNWYTVVNELRLLAAVAAKEDAPLPVLILHDVLWPYGRRDLYYAPEHIPEESRQPYRQAGMRPGQRELHPRGGLNPTMNNAEVEGGPRNGVMTALEDFLAEHPKPVRMLVLPLYFGLAIVVEEERLARQPALAEALDRLESAEGRYDLLEVGETTRLRAMLFQHIDHYQRNAQIDRARGRHLETVKASLLNEHYIDHEARFGHLTRHITKGQPLLADALRDPARNEQEQYRKVVRERTSPPGPDAHAARSFLPYTAMGRPQLDHLHRCLDAVRTDGLSGDLVECGTGRGGGAIFMRAYLDGHELRDQAVWVADRFRASPTPDAAPTLPADGVAGFRADLNLVRDGFMRFGLLDERVHFLQGPFEATLAQAEIGDISLLRVGEPAADDAAGVLDALYDRVVPGGFVVVARGHEAADEFRAKRGITAPLERVDATAVAWRRPTTEAEQVPAARGSSEPAAAGGHPPLAPALGTDPLDLTVVVVMYNMRREAERTLTALSRRYQEGIDDASYEVIVVENGSDPEECLGEAFVTSFGPEFRYLDLGADAQPSPVVALNRGIRAGRGRAFALMIDGAHVVTPGVLRFGLAGLRTYGPSAIVATQQWYVGPGQQGDAMNDGYDVAYEDRLFERIRWPTAGYRLFEIGHFVGDRDWFDGVWESNCMFVPRALLAQVGGFDESFTVGGGGYANLELYERLGSSPDVQVCTIIGEGSFHQTHGGTTTNQPDADERRARVFGYSQHYADLRGRPFKGPGKPIHYVGRIQTQAARRSKPRRMSSQAFAEAAEVGGVDGLPAEPTPMPDEVRLGFLDAVWRTLPWTSTSWLGRRITSAPTDLIAYQEVLASVAPDWVVEIGTGDGGRALFLASVCELLGHGEVLSVDDEHDDDLPRHPRLHLHRGPAQHESVVTAVRERVGEGRAVVVLGARAHRHDTVQQFEAYAPLVPVGSYVIVTDTVVNGNPVWPAFGPGPMEGVKQILTGHGEFVHDPAMIKYSLTFNPGGFLRRVR